MPQQYVVGFMFSKDSEQVALIRKQRPTWQQGKLNGIGGHVEEGEDFLSAMIREFKEETGLDHKDWKMFASINGRGWSVVFFKCWVPREVLGSLETKTDEEVTIISVSSITYPGLVIPNLKWLIPMALDNVESRIYDNN